MTVFRFALSIFIAASFAAHGAMIMPPEMETQADFERFARQMREEMPSLPTYGSRLQMPLISWAQRMDTLADKLRADPDFVKLAAARPDPLNFYFYTYTEQLVKIKGVNAEFTARTHEYFESQYARIFEQDPDQFLAAVKARIAQLGALAGPVPSMGLFSGLGMVFPQDQRREILGRKSLEERSEALKAALKDISDEKLKEVFQSERFGVPRASMTVAKAGEMIDEIVAREQELTMAITLLELFENANLQNIGSEDVTWFTGDDVRDLETGLAPALVERLRQQARTSYSTIEEEKVVREPGAQIIVKEMPAHLAVFRGCPGGDCSTQFSWAYPFSPLERDYYVYLAGNQITELGYVSANILEVNGKKTLFIRDITGRKMAPEHIDLIIEGFAQMLDKIGVTQMTLAASDFTKTNNHYPRLVSRITSFTRNFETVRQTFKDGDIRTEYLNPVVSSAYYDNPGAHARALLYDSAKKQSRTPQIAAQTITNEEIAVFPTSGKEVKLQLLVLGFVSNVEFFIRSANPEFKSWKEFKAALRNKAEHPIGDYFKNLEKYFTEFGLPLNKWVKEKGPDLFWEGLMNASDAFGADHAASTFAMIIDRYQNLREKGVLGKARKHKEEFFKSRPFQKLVQDIFNRQRPIDEQRISELWSFGYHFDDIEMTEEKIPLFLKGMEKLTVDDPRKLPFLVHSYVQYGKSSEMDPRHANSLANWLPVYTRSINNEKWISVMLDLTHFRIRTATALTRLGYIFEGDYNSKLPARFVAALILIKGRMDKPKNIALRPYSFVRAAMENPGIPENLRNRALEIFEELGEENIAALDARMDRYVHTKIGKALIERCEVQVTR